MVTRHGPPMQPSSITSIAGTTHPSTASSDATLLTIALAYWQAGLTPLPHVVGEEEPSYLDKNACVRKIAWGRYKQVQPDQATVRRWFQHGDLQTIRLELLCGSAPVSKYELPARLQILDLESADVYHAFIEMLHFSGLSHLLYRCVIERTPSGGAHMGFLSTQISAQPKVVLAKRASDKKLLIELLQHQPCTVSPTRIAWKSDRPPDAHYRLTQGTWSQPRTLSGEQRQNLIEIARSFNEVPEKVIDHHAASPVGGTRPGDHLNASADIAWWQELLSKHGWREVTRPSHQRQGLYAFQRPGKTGYHLSATLGKCGPYLYVFSSNAQPFEPDAAYSPFAALALLEHDGNFQAAAKALSPPPASYLERDLKRYQRRTAANIARFRAQINADPYFGAPERRGIGITPAVLITEKEPRHE